MGVKGKLTKAMMAHNIPVDAPAYAEGAGYFKRASFIRFDYVTDPDVASQIVPEQLALTDPPTGALMFGEYPWSTAGKYREAILGVNVLYGDEALFYPCYLMLDKAGFGGREVMGYPKKMGFIELVQYEDVMAGRMERPQGFPICSGVVRPEQVLPGLADGHLSCSVSLRVIPSPIMGEPPSLVELIRSETIVSNLEVFSGPGSCSFTGMSVLDPWHKVPVVEMIMASYIVSDFSFKRAQILETL
jgi:acetoacetate decarboxylase